jgi:hypothetical protein
MIGQSPGASIADQTGADQRSILLKTDQRSIYLEMQRDGKFHARSAGWDHTQVLSGGERLEIRVESVQGIVSKDPRPATGRDRPPKPLLSRQDSQCSAIIGSQRYTVTTSDDVTSVPCDGVTRPRQGCR